MKEVASPVILAAVAVAVVLLAAILIGALRLLVSRDRTETSHSEWLENFSLETYAPMERLLDRSDFDFVASQPGYRPEIGKRLLRERRRIFNVYLGRLVRDFNRLVAIAKRMILYAPEDRPDFARALWRQQAIFYFAVILVRCKVALYPYGWTPLDVPKLVHSLQVMHAELRQVAMRLPLDSAI